MSYRVYILHSTKTGRYYIGQTSNLKERLDRHNSGKNRSTKSGAPWVIIYEEHQETRSAAFKREQQIKSYKGGAAFKKLIG